MKGKRIVILQMIPVRPFPLYLLPFPAHSTHPTSFLFLAPDRDRLSIKRLQKKGENKFLQLKKISRPNNAANIQSTEDQRSIANKLGAAEHDTGDKHKEISKEAQEAKQDPTLPVKKPPPLPPTHPPRPVSK